ASGVTAFEGLPVVGSFNQTTPPIGNSVTVHFPAAGTYPYELDYTECCGGQLVLTMAATSASGSSTGIPPSGALTLNPTTTTPAEIGNIQSFTVTATDASGSPQSNIGVALSINGANQQQLSATTNSSGVATFNYVGA